MKFLIEGFLMFQTRSPRRVSLVNVGSLYVILLVGIILSLIAIVIESICQG